MKNFKLLISFLFLLSFNYSFGQVKPDLSITPNEYTYNGIIRTVNGINEKIIYRESDFDTTALGLIDIKNGINYIISDSVLILTRAIDLSNITAISSLRIGTNRIVYSGSGALYRGTMPGSFLVDDALVFGNANSSIWDVKGTANPASNILIIDRSTYVGFGGIGKLDSIGAINYNSVQHANCGEGIIFKDIPILTYGNSPINNTVTSNSPRMVIDGDFTSINISNSPFVVQSGESAIQISKNVSILSSATVTGNQFSTALGGEFFASAKSNVTDTISDNGSGKIRVSTNVNHGLTIEQVVGLENSTLHDGDYDVLTVIDSVTFDLDASFLGADTTDWTTGNSNNFLDSNSFEFVNNGSQINSDEECTYRSDTIINIIIPAVDSIILIVGDTSNWSFSIARRFKVQFAGDTAGSVRYTGNKIRSFKISPRITADVALAAAKEMSGYITIDGVPQLDSQFTHEAARATTLHPELLIKLSPGAVIGTAIENNDDATNIDIIRVNVIIE